MNNSNLPITAGRPKVFWKHMLPPNGALLTEVTAPCAAAAAASANA